MRIAVLNGSPRGENSITLQTVLYLERKFPLQEFHIYPVSSRIRTLEMDMSGLLDAMEMADLLIFAYPVYTFMAPSQLHHFIDMLKRSDRDFSDKYVTQITTSKHFFDVTAHRYMEDNFHDMGMKVIRGFSADMDDLLTDKGQKESIAFFRRVLMQIQNEYFEPGPAVYMRGLRVPPTLTVTAQEMRVKSTQHSIAVVTDLEYSDEQLFTMIERFKRVFPFSTKVINIREYPFKGGCIGCLNCASGGNCIYTDGFSDYLRNEIQSQNAIVYAFTIRDHSMGWYMKQFDDRQFCNGHRTVTMGKPVGYIISGDYRCEENLRTVIEARAQAGGNYLAGVATDELDTDHSINRMADTLAYAIEERYTEPQNFYGVGGMKIFRDLIYLMRGMMRADHRFYKKHKLYDYPHKKKRTIFSMYIVGRMFANERLRKKLGPKINEGMLDPYKKVIEGKKRI